MRVRVIKQFSSTTYGNMKEGDIIPDMPESLAKHNIAAGRVQPHEATYNTKVVREVPTVAGEDKELSLSPADPASPKRTYRKSGKKKSSRSTVQSD